MAARATVLVLAVKLKLEAKEGLETRNTKAGETEKAQNYKDDPLIQEALEMFKGEIKS